ncbi:hypothetical protein BBJ28_00016199 [Nothophytophthora sp. Chile5]|nr:hypothetical protein BBJ28_00016199 [Nothophytophthora sp. Chile5]
MKPRPTLKAARGRFLCHRFAQNVRRIYTKRLCSAWDHVTSIGRVGPSSTEAASHQSIRLARSNPPGFSLSQLAFVHFAARSVRRLLSSIYSMACSNPASRHPASPSSPGLSFHSKPTASAKQQVTYDSDGIESDDDTLLTLTSLAKMEASCVARREDERAEESLRQQTPSAQVDTGAITERSAECLDGVQQAICAVEDALARCSWDARHQALAELLTHAKLEQAKKATHTRARSADCCQHASIWAAVLQHVQELGRDNPKEYDLVHQLVFLVQQCVGKTVKPEVPEEEDQQDLREPDDQQQESESDDKTQEERQQQGFSDEAELCGRLGEAAVDVDLPSDEEESEQMISSDEGEESNQTEDDSEGRSLNLKETNPRDHDGRRDETEVEDVDELVAPVAAPPIARELPPVAMTRLRALLPILTADIKVKAIQEPRPPRGGVNRAPSNSTGSSGASNKAGSKNSRLKFQFHEAELLRLIAEDDEDVKRRTGSTSSLASRSSMQPHSHRRFSSAAAITGTVPLRRKSFSMKRSPLKSASIVSFAPLSAGPSFNIPESSKASSPIAPVKASQHWAARRKSTSACYTTSNPLASRRTGKSFSVTKSSQLSKKKATISAAASLARSASGLSSSSSTAPSLQASTQTPPQMQTQMVIRVRERKGDRVPEIVIAKKPVRFVVWHWNDRCIRVPFLSAANIMPLGPAQHGIMLRQLRYVKSVMHEFPWAKAHLRALLSKYTAKEVSKEELYPQLNALGQHVQREIGQRARQHRALAARKQRLTVTLTVATGVVNDTFVTKFGRRGRPHASRLLYDPSSPLQLRWRRKHGERSVEFLAVDEIRVVEIPDASPRASANGGTGAFGRGNKKAAAAVAVDPASCLSLVTPTRSLDLQVASSLHREWLANAIRDLVSFAQQYKAASGNADAGPSSNESGEARARALMITAPTRRPRQLMTTRQAMLY